MTTTDRLAAALKEFNYQMLDNGEGAYSMLFGAKISASTVETIRAVLAAYEAEQKQEAKGRFISQIALERVENEIKNWCPDEGPMWIYIRSALLQAALTTDQRNVSEDVRDALEACMGYVAGAIGSYNPLARAIETLIRAATTGKDLK